MGQFWMTSSTTSEMGWVKSGLANWGSGTEVGSADRKWARSNKKRTGTRQKVRSTMWAESGQDADRNADRKLAGS